MKMTNAEYAKKDDEFRAACSKARIAPTARQASKYRRKMGKAYQIERTEE